MASGNDARVGVAVESTYGTRVAPAKFIPINGESISYEHERYFSGALGLGRWARPSVLTTSVGSGSINGEVPTSGFGYLLQGLHGNTVTPAAQAGTPTPYVQNHTLSTPPDKSFSVQVQTPPVGSATLIPQDLVGLMMTGITFSWEPGGVLMYEIPVICRALDVSQSLATYTAPADLGLLSFKGGSLTIGGVTVADLVGGGSCTIGFGLRDDAYPLGSSGLIAKPVEADKPTATITTTADFTDLTHLNRVLNNTVADVVLDFSGDTIAGIHKYSMRVTIPDCVSTTPRPQVEGPGPVQQPITLSNASTSGDPVVLRYASQDASL